MSRIGVLGPGGIGGLIGVLLASRGHEVVCIAPPGSVEALARRGLTLESPFYGELAASVAAMPALDVAVDVLFVTVKAPSLAPAIQSVEPALVAAAHVVSLLNGVEHLAVLRSRYGEAVVAASIGAVESFTPEPGRVVHRSHRPPVVTLVDGAAAAWLGPLLEDAAIVVELKTTEAEVMWDKLARLVAVAATTAASGLSLGGVRDDPSRREWLRAVVAEAAAVARAEGAPVSDETVLGEIDRLPADLRTSLERDVSAGDLGEADAIVGAVLRAASRHAIPTPTLAAALEEIRARASTGPR